MNTATIYLSRKKKKKKKKAKFFFLKIKKWTISNDILVQEGQ